MLGERCLSFLVVVGFVCDFSMSFPPVVFWVALAFAFVVLFPSGARARVSAKIVIPFLFPRHEPRELYQTG